MSAPVPRLAWLEALVGALDPARDILVSCLGANARYLPHLRVPVPCFALADAMGAAIPLALGIALARPTRQVIALEGDGALLMNLGTLATVAAARARNLTTLLFDNGHYESSGGQDLPRAPVDFAAAARAAGLPIAERLDAADRLPAALGRARGAGPAFFVLPTVWDPRERVPPYSEYPLEIRAAFAQALAAQDARG